MKSKNGIEYLKGYKANEEAERNVVYKISRY